VRLGVRSCTEVQRSTDFQGSHSWSHASLETPKRLLREPANQETQNLVRYPIALPLLGPKTALPHRLLLRPRQA
jgi:hypothetical protein